ncbi:MAG: hypothetical protein ACK50M_05200, partial [Cyclobacteriaceae bacterium]
HICFGFYIIRGSRSFLSAVPAFIFSLMLKDNYLSDFQQNCCDKVELKINLNQNITNALLTDLLVFLSLSEK